MWRCGSLVFLTLVAVLATTAARADCASLRHKFDSAILSQTAPAIISAYREVEASNTCDFDPHGMSHRAIDGVIDALTRASDKAPPEGVAEWLFGRLSLSGEWRSAERLGKYFDKLGDLPKAQLAYELAISLVGKTPASQPSVAELQLLSLEAFTAKSLASNDDQGRSPKPLSRSLRNADGTIGGTYALLTRRVGIGKLPMPVNFAYDSTDLTPGGKEAVAELAEVVMQQELDGFRLTGHADPRGDAGYNLQLSRERARALVAALEDVIRASPSHYLSNHKMPTIVADGKGAAEPFDTSFLGYEPSQDEIWQLDRRVEFEFLHP